MANQPGTRASGVVIVDQTPEELDLAFTDGSMPSEADAEVALRALVIHVAEHWPHGDFCRNCRARFPCRLARWGHRVLKLAGWSDYDIAKSYAEFQRTGKPLWTVDKPVPANEGRAP